MQLTKAIFSDTAIFIEKTTVENLLWAKSEDFNHPTVQPLKCQLSLCTTPNVLCYMTVVPMQFTVW